jgi:hypothetical protein
MIYPDHPVFRTKYPVKVRNSTGAVIPACAVMRVTNWTNVDNGVVANVAKPNATLFRRYLVNGPLAIGAASTDEGYAGYLDNWDGPVMYGSGTPALDEEWGATDAQWYLTKNRPGFIVAGSTTTTFNSTNILAARGYLLTQVLGKPNSNIALDASGTVNVWGGTPGSEATTGLSIPTVFAKTQALVTTDFVTVGWLNGKPYAAKFVC